jgi:hypothetical protein
MSTALTGERTSPLASIGACSCLPLAILHGSPLITADEICSRQSTKRPESDRNVRRRALVADTVRSRRENDILLSGVGRSETAASVFQSITPNASAINSGLWLLVMLRPLAERAARRVLAMALASRKSRMSCILCLNETGASGACVSDPFVRAKGHRRLRYVDRTPKGRKQQVISTARKDGLETGQRQSRVSALRCLWQAAVPRPQ